MIPNPTEQAIRNLQQVFSPGQMLQMSQWLLEIQRVGYGELRIEFFRGNLRRIMPTVSVLAEDMEREEE